MFCKMIISNKFGFILETVFSYICFIFCYTACQYHKYCYAEFVILNVFVQSFIMLSVVILSVVAPPVLAYQEITLKGTWFISSLKKTANS